MRGGKAQNLPAPVQRSEEKRRLPLCFPFLPLSQLLGNLSICKPFRLLVLLRRLLRLRSRIQQQQSFTSRTGPRDSLFPMSLLQSQRAQESSE